MALRPIDVEQHGADAGSRDAEQQAETEEHERVEDQCEEEGVGGELEKRRDERQGDEIADGDGDGEKRLVEGAAA